MICSHHHRQIHEGGFSLCLTATGEVEVRGPDGICLPAQPALSADLGTVEWYVDARDDWTGESEPIDEWTATPAWDGEAIDYDAVVGALISP
jgi:hypothetical protein